LFSPSFSTSTRRNFRPRGKIIPCDPAEHVSTATLARQDKYQLQWRALGLVGARPVEQKKGADHGIDGKILFRDDPKAVKPE
jgi:hypothetical protein